MRPPRAAVGVVLAAAAVSSAAGCSASSRDNVKKVAETVLTLQTGTVSELKDRRGTGPFREYDVPPAEMLDLAAAVLRARIVAVFPEPLQGVVVGKERSGKDALDDSYAPAFDAAVAVFVHPVPGSPGRCRVEVHCIQRGPLRRGAIDWARELPPALDEAARTRKAPVRPL